MDGQGRRPEEAASRLREQAEAQLADVTSPAVERPAAVVLHELQVHQIELEMQNETLRQAQVALEESRDRYVDFYEFAPVGFLSLTREGQIAEANLSAAALLGMERRSLLQQRFDTYVLPVDLDRWQQMFFGVMRDARGPEQHIDLALRQGSGSVLDVHLDCLKVGSEESSPLLRIALTDISELKRAEQTLRHQTAWLRQVMDSIPDLIFVKDPNSVYLACNKAFERFAGRPEGEQIGKTDFDFFDPDTARSFRDLDRRTMQAGLLHNNEERVTYPDGRQVILDTLKTPFYGLDNALLGLVGISRDITARKQSEEQIRQFNRVLRTVSACNEALVRAGNETDLLGDICRIIVEIGGYQLAWVAVATPAGSSTPVAWHGNLALHLAHAEMDHDPEHLSHCLVQAALNSRRTQICNRLDSVLNCRFDELRQLGVESALSLPLINDGRLHGALTIFSAQADTFDAAEVSLMEELAADLAYGIAALRMTQERDRTLLNLEQAVQGTVIAMARTLEMRDPYTAGHQQRVTALAEAIAREMALEPGLIEGLKFGGMIHDIGKIGVPAEILSKPGRLTFFEMQLIQQHPETGRRIVADIDFPWPLAQIIVQHHERLDGSGYPAGLKGDEIMMEARILAVADVVEAMSSHRPYRPSLGVEAALAEIELGSGVAFDAAVVAACIKVVRGNGMRLPEQ